MLFSQPFLHFFSNSSPGEKFNFSSPSSLKLCYISLFPFLSLPPTLTLLH